MESVMEKNQARIRDQEWKKSSKDPGYEHSGFYFWELSNSVSYLNSFTRIRIKDLVNPVAKFSGLWQPNAGVDFISPVRIYEFGCWIRDGKNKSGISIPDPQLWYKGVQWTPIFFCIRIFAIFLVMPVREQLLYNERISKVCLSANRRSVFRIRIRIGSVFNRTIGSGSGSVIWIRIRIRIQEGKNDPQK